MATRTRSGSRPGRARGRTAVRRRAGRLAWATARLLGRAAAASARAAAWAAPRLARATWRASWRLARATWRGSWRLARWARRRPRAALAALTAGAAPALVALALGPWPPAPDPGPVDSLECLALNIYHEARGEPEEGRLAVAQVVMNRVADPGFPDDVCAVVRQAGTPLRHACQFSWWCDGRSDRPREAAAWEDSKALARLVLNGATADPTGGALWYHADYVRPEWRMAITPAGRIGQHLFYLPAAVPAGRSAPGPGAP